MKQNSPETDLIFDEGAAMTQCGTMISSMKGAGSIGYLQGKIYFDASSYTTQRFISSGPDTSVRTIKQYRLWEKI